MISGQAQDSEELQTVNGMYAFLRKDYGIAFPRFLLSFHSLYLLCFSPTYHRGCSFQCEVSTHVFN